MYGKEWLALIFNNFSKFTEFSLISDYLKYMISDEIKKVKDVSIINEISCDEKECMKYGPGKAKCMLN